MRVGSLRHRDLILIAHPTTAGTAAVDDIALNYRRRGSHLSAGQQHVDEVGILTVKAK